MSTIPQRIASAFAILCGRYGDVTRLARGRERSRQSLYREAQQVVDAVDGAAARIGELQQQVARQQAEIEALRARVGRVAEIPPDQQDEFATVAQAEGVSLPVACRLLQVLQQPGVRSVPTLGRATAAAGRHAGRLLEILDEAARPRVAQAAADEIFSDGNRS